MVTRDDIVAAARRYIGVPFRKGGRSDKSIDCVGLLIKVHQDLGLQIEDSTDYTFSPLVATSYINDLVRGQSTEAPIAPVLRGQIAIMRETVFPMHFGIIARSEDRLTFINANTKERRVVEQDFSEWRTLLIELREFKGLVN